MARPTKSETHEEKRARQRENERRYRERQGERYRELKREQDHRYRERHHEERNARKRDRHAAKADEINTKRKASYAANPEPARAAVRKYAAERREEMRQKSYVNYRKYRDRYRTYHVNRRARELGADGRYTEEEWRELVDRYNYRCAYCGVNGPLTRDHRVPLSRGGTNWISNLIPACAACNNRKHASTETEYRALLAKEVTLG